MPSGPVQGRITLRLRILRRLSTTIPTPTSDIISCHTPDPDDPRRCRNFRSEVWTMLRRMERRGEVRRVESTPNIRTTWLKC